MADAANINKRQYFATLAPNDLASDLLEKVAEYDMHIVATGRWAAWERSYNFYNQGIYKDARINRSGEEGEYTDIFVNHFRNLLTHMLVMTTSQRPSYDSRATNTDYDSQSQTIVANGILEFYDRFKSLNKISKQAVEDCLIFADAYVYEGWDFSQGEPVAPSPETGQVVKSGDLEFKNYTPLDVVFDTKGGLRDAKRQWYVIRDFQNKWDLVARYPELKDKILRYGDDQAYTKYSGSRFFRGDSDFVPVFIFVHDRTDAVPDGRYFTFMGRDCTFVDSQLPSFYKTLPIKRLVASEQRGTGFGYTIAYDLCPLQEAVNGLHSTVLTNQSTFGVQNIMVPKGADIGVAELSDGMNVITYDSKLGPPQALNLVSTPKEIFDYIEMVESVMQTISGVNSVQRGNPEASLKSGNALALIQSMAVQFMSGLQEAYANLLEDLGTGLIDILKEQATTPRLIEIAGKNNKSYVDSFTKKNITDISRVTVDLGNPVSRTLAGKVNMAENLLNAKLIETPEQYIQVLTTGKLEPLIEGRQAELMLIKDENEKLSNGTPVQAIMVDNHHLHIMEHKAVIASSEARINPAIVQSTLNHIMEHINLWRTADPNLMGMIGEPIPPPPPMPVPPQGVPGAGAPPAPGAGPHGNGTVHHTSVPEVLPGNPANLEAARIALPKPAKPPAAAALNGGSQ